ILPLVVHTLVVGESRISWISKPRRRVLKLRRLDACIKAALVELIDQPAGETHGEVRLPSNSIANSQVRHHLPAILSVRSEIPFANEQRVRRSLREAEQISC